MNVFKIMLLFFMAMPIPSFAVCKFEFPRIPYADLKSLYFLAGEEDRDFISRSETSVGLVFGFLMRADEEFDGSDFSMVDWRRDRLLIEYLYYSGLMDKRAVLDAAVEMNVSSVLNSEVFSSQGAVDVSIERELLSLQVMPDPAAYYSMVLINKHKYPDDPINYGVRSLAAVGVGELRALGFLSDFYSSQGCVEYSELAAALDGIFVGTRD